MRHFSIFLSTIILGLSLCSLSCGSWTGTASAPGQAKQDPLKQKAENLAQKFIIVDTHIDLPYRLHKGFEDVSLQTEKGEMDYVRAKKGGLNAPFMSIYTPSLMQTTGGSKNFADQMIDLVEELTKKWPDKFAVATSVAQVREQFGKGLVSLPMGMENGSPVEGDLANLQHFYDRGIRYITLTHATNNEICDSSYDEERTWNGLSPFGRLVVEEMNRLGIMVDVSHVSDDTFFQVMALSKAPVLASHSSCRHFTPGFERNMSDEMIVELAKKDGVIMINFGSSFIDDIYLKKSEQAREDLKLYREEHQLEDTDPAYVEYRKTYFKENLQVTDISRVIDHIEHVIKLVGVDHVGFGSDFDGVGDSLPTGLKDVSFYPNIIFHLLQRGYSETDIEKICSGNLLRLWSRVEQYAAAQAAPDEE